MRRGRILVIEDDPALAGLVAEELRAGGYDVTHAATGGDGLAEAALQPFDLVLLDLGLPDVDGLEVAERLRDDDVPILMVTARGDVESRVQGLYAGASDYLTKPFDVRELVARVHARLRETLGGEVLRHGELEFVPDTRTVRVAERTLILPEREGEVLRLLLAHPGRVFSRAELEHRIYQGEPPTSNTVQVYISQLRRKLAELGLGPVVRTVRGKGYTVA